MREFLRRTSPTAIAWAGFLAGIAWAFFGSLVLHLGVSPLVPTRLVWLWLGGEAAICALAALAARLAAAPRDD